MLVTQYQQRLILTVIVPPSSRHIGPKMNLTLHRHTVHPDPPDDLEAEARGAEQPSYRAETIANKSLTRGSVRSPS